MITKIEPTISNTNVKHILLYDGELWLLNEKAMRKSASVFINKCFRRITYPNIISNTDLWSISQQELIEVLQKI